MQREPWPTQSGECGCGLVAVAVAGSGARSVMLHAADATVELT